jgi:hypothetical protein
MNYWLSKRHSRKMLELRECSIELTPQMSFVAHHSARI